MAFDETLVDEVRLALSGMQVAEKKMFGGLGFMVNGKLCIAVNNRPDHIMMVRIDSSNHEALKREGATIAVMRGRQMSGWIYLTKEAIDTQKNFDYWIRLALDYNKTIAGK